MKGSMRISSGTVSSNASAAASSCRGQVCAQCNFEEDSPECVAFQELHGCHKCSKRHCSTKTRMCVFFGRDRFQVPDAQLGDTVPHMSQASVQFYSDGRLMALQRMSAKWWQSYKLVEVSVDNQMYTQGYASGEGCNCLIDTLRQMLNIISNTKRVRMELKNKFTTGPRRIRSGDFLELQHHWKDVIDLLFRYDEMDLPVTPSGGRL